MCVCVWGGGVHSKEAHHEGVCAHLVPARLGGSVLAAWLLLPSSARKVMPGTSPNSPSSSLSSGTWGVSPRLSQLPSRPGHQCDNTNIQ